MRSKFLGWWMAPALVCVAPLLIPFVLGQEQPSKPDAPDSKEPSKRADQTRGKRRPRGDDPPEILDDGTKPHAPETVFTKGENETVLLSPTGGRQAPFFLARKDAGAGSTAPPTLGYVQWTPKVGDQIVLCDPSRPGSEEKDAPRRIVNAQPAEIVRPIGLCDALGRARLFWTELVDGAAQLRGTMDPGSADEVGREFTPPVTLTHGPLPNLNVEATLHSDGRIWLAWESESPPATGAARGSRDVCIAPLADDMTLGERVVVGDGPFSELDPGIVSSGDKLWIVWVAYCGRDYEVRLRSFDPKTKALSDVIEVSRDSASDDLHPSLAAAPNGDLWVAWDRVENPTRGDSAPASLSLAARGAATFEIDVRVACVRGGEVLVLPAASETRVDGEVPGALLLSTGGGVPRIAVDGGGRVWIAYHELLRSKEAEKAYTFPVLVQSLDEKGWSAPIETDRRTPIPEEAALALTSAGATIAYSLGPIGIGVTRVDAPPTATSTPPLVERAARVAVPHFHPFADRLDDPYVTGAQHFEITRGPTKADPKNAEKWQVYWGDLHRHSNVSRCSRGMEPSPSDRWEAGRDVHLYDFMALTDHSGQINPLASWDQDKLCWLYQSPTYCTLAGYEWSSPRFGHHNIILRGRMSELVSPNASLKSLYDAMKPEECVTIPHHSSDVKFSNDFTPIDDHYTRLIEVYQACRGSYEFDGCFKQSPSAGVIGSFVQDAFENGHEFGIIASTDHGYGQAYACVLATSLDRESIFDGLRQRRTYGATAKGMLIDLRVDDAIMGEATTCRAPPRVRLHALGASELADVVIFRNGRIWQSTRSGAPAVANRLAPARLLLRLPAAATPASRVTFTVRTSKGRFEAPEERRDRATSETTPGWSCARDTATFTWPEGSKPAETSNEWSLHLRAAEEASFVITIASEEKSVSVAELAAHPLALPTPAGECTLALELGDAAIDLAKGLGTRDFTGEWQDAEVKPGRSWYYARMIQTDGEMAWSSPIFVERQ